MITGKFPHTRLRRNRNSHNVRALIAENHLSPADLLQPVFVIPEADSRTEIPHMPGIVRMGIHPLLEYVATLQDLGVPGVFLFSNIPARQRRRFVFILERRTRGQFWCATTTTAIGARWRSSVVSFKSN